MSQSLDVIALVGSLRRESYTARLTRGLVSLAPPSMNMEIVPLGGLSMYNQDDEANPPQPWREFRERVRRCDAVLFVTPEYNRGLPAVMKNAIDIGSRPYGKSAWNGKPAAVVSNSPGALGGFGANHSLRQSLVFLNMPTLQIEAYVGGSDKLFDAEGNFTVPATKEFCSKLMSSFERWIQEIRSGQAP
jgi:chromate reductase